ncbi:hypothetical protein [Caldimonas tepidiphila]|uniref:hypothetical protein n=1 Tax=Caldimonas tepidiphila TaxID=2315841 RepID=UPI0013003F31|nr:hypothetical protein [Caldimonas tepidiphila]
MTDHLGWFAPTVTRHELASLAINLAEDIRAIGADTIEPSIETLVRDIPRRAQTLQNQTVPYFYNGNAGQSIPAYISTISLLRAAILPPLGWQVIPDQKSLPSSLARRARAALAELDQLTPNISTLKQQISDIESAHAIADSLPVDLQALAEGREKLAKAVADATEAAFKVKEARDAAALELSAMATANLEAGKLIKQCEAAYHITTTKGLAGAFDQRAVSLSNSMWIWVLGLMGALIVGSFIGTQRLQDLSTTLSAPNPNLISISIHVLLSLLSVGAPLWFAWLATKQIGQRFRLSEDYAFKASVAKAYEGYRKEAARIDPEFESRLFGSALTRLDEAPLRLVEATNHSSPWHEMANSDAVHRAFRAAPEFQNQVMEMLREGVKTAGQTISRTSKAAGNAIQTEKT